MQKLGAGERLDRHHTHPEVPVHPAGRETGPIAEPKPREFGECTHVGIGGRHLAEHAHDEQDDEAGEEIAHHDGRADRGDGGAGADKKTGADDAADGDHADVARPQILGELWRSRLSIRIGGDARQ